MADYLHRKSHTHERAREALRKAGHKGPLQKINALVYAIEVETGRACVGDQTEFIRAWLDSMPVAAKNETQVEAWNTPTSRPTTSAARRPWGHSTPRLSMASNGGASRPAWTAARSCRRPACAAALGPT